MPVPPASPGSRAPGRGARLLIGLVFLGAAGFWAYTALNRGEPKAATRVHVRVVDEAGRPLSRAQARTRYGGTWLNLDQHGEVVVLDPRTRAGLPDPFEALSDAFEARAPFHAARRGRRPDVRVFGCNAYLCVIALEPCGLLRLGVAPSGFPGARATVDPDGAEERWRLTEGLDVIRAGEAATYAVFAGAPALWVTLEGDRGVAQVRLELPAPGLGQLLERSLGPEPALPIRGRVRLPDGAWVPSLHGRLEVRELREDGRPAIARPSVVVAPDGAFAVEYAGQGRFELSALLPFANVALPVGAAAGDGEVRIEATPRPWIELSPASLVALKPSPRVSLFAVSGGDDLLEEGGAVALERSLAVAAPAAGVYRVVVATRASEAGPARSGEVQVLVPAEGAVPAELTLTDLPHGTLKVLADPVPEPGGEVRVAPDRMRTLLPRLATQAEFLYLPVGRALCSASWRDPTLADELFVADMTADATTELRLAPVKGGRVRLVLAGTWAEHARGALVLRISAGQTPYGAAEGLLPLAREGSVPVYQTRAALRPGPYRATVHRAGAGDGPTLAVEFTLEAGQVVEARVSAP